MRPSRKLGLSFAAAVLLAIATSWSAVSFAQGQGAPGQQAPPQRIRIQITQVKPDMVDAYQNIIKSELIPGLKKAGLPWLWTYATGPIGQGFTFINAQPITGYAQYDQPGTLQKALGPDGVAKYNAKLRPTLVSTNAWIQTINPAMSIMSTGATAPPALVVVQDFQVIPGKNGEFADIMTKEYLPAMKKAGVKDFWVYNTNFGGPGGRVTTVRAIAKYAELDPQPGGGLLVQGGLTQQAAQQLNARRAALISGTETNIYRYVPDLSFGMPTPPKTN
jgi:hypothetical protein